MYISSIYSLLSVADGRCWGGRTHVSPHLGIFENGLDPLCKGEVWLLGLPRQNDFADDVRIGLGFFREKFHPGELCKNASFRGEEKESVEVLPVRGVSEGTVQPDTLSTFVFQVSWVVVALWSVQSGTGRDV